MKALVIERERVDGEGIFIWEEDSGGEGIFADINAYEFLGGHIHHLLWGVSKGGRGPSPTNPPTLRGLEGPTNL